MTKYTERDQWLQDIDRRQRNLVFPDTLQNETRFWRNLGNSSWTTSTKIGMVVLALFVIGWMSAFVRAGFEDHRVWLAFALLVPVGGSFLGLLGWASRRALKDIKGHGRHPGPRSR